MSAGKALSLAAGADWLDRAWALWCRRPLFFAGTALLVLVLRWVCDLLPTHSGTAAAIFLSYLTDALVMVSAWAVLSLDEERAPLTRGWALTGGRRGKIARAGLWGLPVAALSYLLLGLAGPLFETVGVAVGARLAGWLMLAWLFLVGWLCCGWLCAALFAAMEAQRGEDRLWLAGIKGLRAAWAGRFPLLVVWIAFAGGAAAYSVLSTGLLGHLTLDTVDGAARQWLEYWINWPALFVAVMALCALMKPMSDALLAGDGGNAALEIKAFGENLALRFSQGLKLLAALLVPCGLLAIDMSLTSVLVGALGLWLTGYAASRSVPAWGDPDAGLWARWKWLVFPTAPLVLLWLGTLTL